MTSRGRVLIVSHNHPKVRPGGAETYAHELHLALRDSPDWEPVFLARSGPPQSRSGRPHTGTRFAGVDGAEDEYFVYPDGYDFDWLLGTMRLDKRLYSHDLRDFLLAVRPDVVHFQHTLFLGYDAIREVRRTLPGASIVYTLHEFLPICHHKGQMVRTMDHSLCDHDSPRRCHECFPDISPQSFFLRRRFIQAQLDLVDMFVAPSAVLLERFVEWGIPRERILLEDYGRPPGPAPVAPGRGEPHATLGFFGQVNPYKGIDVLLAALARVRERAREGAGGPEASGGGVRPHLRLHGANLDLQEHGFRDRVRALIDRGSDDVTFAGPYAPEQVGELMTAVDWVVVPSIWWENSPLVIQEAFANRRPVICSDVGGMAEKVADGVSGLHFRVGDAGSLADAIERAVGTPGLWERLQAGVPRVHPMDEHVRVLGEAYRRLVKDRRGRQPA